MSVSQTAKNRAADLVRDSGETYAEALGLDLTRNTPSPLFRWLCAALLLSARISAGVAMNAAAALAEKGWTTPQKMAATSWAERTRVLNAAGYARYDESTSRRLADLCTLVLEEYGGDLRRLRDRAGKDSARERELIKEVKGIGDVGADIFCREVQIAWRELYPFVDARALKSAKALGLAATADDVAGLVPEKDLPRLLAALVRADLQR